MTFKLRQFALMHGTKLHTACGDTTLKNGAGKETMEFLKDILGEDLYKQVSDTVNAYNGKPENKDKQVKLQTLDLVSMLTKASMIPPWQKKRILPVS